VRLSDADRELLYEHLARHQAAGRMTVEELERRVAAVAGAQTEEEAWEVLSDLPPLPPPGTTPEGGRGRGHAEA
jgi:hypothetical protein